MINCNKGDLLLCTGARDYPGLTIGKTYVALGDLDAGIFENLPYISVIGDNGKALSCHATRFEINKKEKTNAKI